MRIPAHIRRDANGTVRVYCPDLPGCSAHAESLDFALALLRTRVREYFAESERTEAPPNTLRTTIEL